MIDQCLGIVRGGVEGDGQVNQPESELCANLKALVVVFKSPIES